MTALIEHAVLDEDAACRNRTATRWPAPTRGGAPVVLGDVARRMPRLTRRITVVHSALFLLTHGRFLSRWFGNPVLVLETVGRRTGTRRLTPLVYLPYRNNFAVLPANAGADRSPAWWLNLQAAGQGFAVVNGKRHPITPTIATGLEHDRLWHQFCAIAPIEHYQHRAHRSLPIIVLTTASRPPAR
jgi:F420H(2)-dependent quinone reductase